jgi:hypothetical protein
MKLFTALTVCALSLNSMQAQASQPTRERPVYMTAQRLASLCREWQKFPVGYLDESATEYSVSPKQFVRAMGCISYIEGSADALLQATSDDAPYTPRAGTITGVREAVDYFVRYMGRHSEDNELAAVTILRQCEIEKAKK